jgi:two-component system response regulator AtoC
MTGSEATVLVVDDDPAMAAAYANCSGNPVTARLGPAALDIVKRHKPDLLISDLRMTEMTGHQLQVELSKLAPDLPVIIITAFGSIESAVESMKLGARDFITNPSGTRNSCRQFLA